MNQVNQQKHGRKISRKTLLRILGIEIAILVVLASLVFLSTSRQVIMESLTEIKNLRTDNSIASDAPGLPGVTPAEIQARLEDEGLSCESLGEDEEGRYHLKCSKTKDSLNIETLILGQSEERVDLIDININQSGEASDDVAGLYLCEISSLMSDNAVKNAACSWIRQTLPEIQDANDVHKNTFAGIRHILYGNPESRSLEMGRLP
jgi:hypothetical protein